MFLLYRRCPHYKFINYFSDFYRWLYCIAYCYYFFLIAEKCLISQSQNVIVISISYGLRVEKTGFCNINKNISTFLSYVVGQFI